MTRLHFEDLSVGLSWHCGTVTLTGGVRSSLTLPLTNTDATKLLSFSVTIGSTNVSLINLKGLADSSAVAAALNSNSGFSSAGLSATWSGSVLTILDDGIAAFSNVSLLRADEVDSSVAYTTGDAVPSTAVFNVTTASVNATMTFRIDVAGVLKTSNLTGITAGSGTSLASKLNADAIFVGAGLSAFEVGGRGGKFGAQLGHFVPKLVALENHGAGADVGHKAGVDFALYPA